MIHGTLSLTLPANHPRIYRDEPGNRISFFLISFSTCCLILVVLGKGSGNVLENRNGPTRVPEIDVEISTVFLVA